MELHRPRRGSVATLQRGQERFADIPRQQPARLRNRIVHGYWSIDLEILHTTATEQLPAFASELRNALDSLTAETEEAPASHAPDSPSGHAPSSDT